MRPSLLPAAATLALLAAPLCAAPAFAQNAGSQSLTPHEETFAKEAAIGNLSEVEAGQYAETHAASPAVREFGRWLATDHTMAQQLLELSVRPAGLQLPTTPDQEHKQKIEQLTRLHGQQFDQAFVTAMVQDHEKDVGTYQKESEDGHSRLRGYAIMVLPGLEQHLLEAQDLNHLAKEGGLATAAGGDGAGSASSVGNGSQQ